MFTKPINFGSEMVLAIIDGRKTQTRRIIKTKGHDVKKDCPYGCIGQRLRVREAWMCAEYPSRIFLEIKNIRVERLSQITEKDAMAEGVEKSIRDQMDLFGEIATPTYRDGFIDVWDGIHGAGAFDSSPYVWVIDFMAKLEDGK